MYGIEAINAVNGWAMASVGALIVFSGLVILSFVISQLHKFVPLLEKINGEKAAPKDTISTPPPPAPIKPPDIREQASLFQPIIDTLGASFPLSALYTQANKQNIPHPHLTISAFRDAGILAPQGDGIFSWDPHKLIAPPQKPAEPA
ncbi:MAG: OadG family protein [Desulfobulbaceae bacterium]|uniref:OadG family protein n=1 Tax=Candidatus Desulfobia pelagia TaxID=2841692 RepID=A0A8J6NG32_9BACT|nr:OadG family protein [Candidatus Desulfobia pelagia]